MVTTKIATATFCFDPAVKKALHTAAARDRHASTNIMKVLIREHCGRNGISMLEQGDLLGSETKDST